jgi:hypothetical protein
MATRRRPRPGTSRKIQACFNKEGGVNLAAFFAFASSVHHVVVQLTLSASQARRIRSSTYKLKSLKDLHQSNGWFSAGFCFGQIPSAAILARSRFNGLRGSSPC